MARKRDSRVGKIMLEGFGVDSEVYLMMGERGRRPAACLYLLDRVCDALAKRHGSSSRLV